MLAAFLLACRDAAAPPQRRALLASLAAAALLFAALTVILAIALDRTEPFGLPWLDLPIAVLGGVAVLALAWLLYPAAAILVLGFYLEGVLARLERQHYPALPPARGAGWADTARSVVALALLTMALNLLALPFYLWPAANLLLYYGLNGYLMGRQYFELVALRRLDRAERRRVWRSHRARFVGAGLVIALLMSVPLLDLAAPLLAAAFMLHLFAAPAPDPRKGGISASLGV